MRYTWMLPCAVLGGVLMAACQVLIYRYAPVEQTMGLVQKIFYTHLPLAWWSFVSFFLVCVSGVAYLKTRNRHWDAVAGAAAEVGVVLSGLALVSGSIWARHSWGVWWTWDPRLTTELILLFLYLGVMGLYAAIDDRRNAARAAGLLAIVGVALLPVIRWSVVWWNSLHQGQTISLFGKSGMDSSMEWPFWLMFAALHIWFFGSLLLRARADNLRREAGKDWVAKMAARP